MKIMVAIHHHRHGIDPYLYDIPDGLELTEEHVIDLLGEEFEKDREEWVELFGPYTGADIEKLSVIK